MFLDLKSSTAIAERIGQKNYLMLLNDCFYDVTVAIRETQGEIYKYVGDEVIISWIMERGLEKSNCVRCFFIARDGIREARDLYVKRYGLAPEFKAGIHGGQVVVGEMGEDKTEIGYLGDVLNTASRIQSECNAQNRDLLVSGDVLDRLSLPADLRVESLGAIRLRGKEREIELYGLERIS